MKAREKKNDKSSFILNPIRRRNLVQDKNCGVDKSQPQMKYTHTKKRRKETDS